MLYFPLVSLRDVQTDRQVGNPEHKLVLAQAHREVAESACLLYLNPGCWAF